MLLETSRRNSAMVKLNATAENVSVMLSDCNLPVPINLPELMSRRCRSVVLTWANPDGIICSVGFPLYAINGIGKAIFEGWEVNSAVYDNFHFLCRMAAQDLAKSEDRIRDGIRVAENTYRQIDSSKIGIMASNAALSICYPRLAYEAGAFGIETLSEVRFFDKKEIVSDNIKKQRLYRNFLVICESGNSYTFRIRNHWVYNDKNEYVNGAIKKTKELQAMIGQTITVNGQTSGTYVVRPINMDYAVRAIIKRSSYNRSIRFDQGVREFSGSNFIAEHRKVKMSRIMGTHFSIMDTAWKAFKAGDINEAFYDCITTQVAWYADQPNFNAYEYWKEMRVTKSTQVCREDTIKVAQFYTMSKKARAWIKNRCNEILYDDE